MLLNKQELESLKAENKSLKELIDKLKAFNNNILNDNAELRENEKAMMMELSMLRMKGDFSVKLDQILEKLNTNSC